MNTINKLLIFYFSGTGNSKQISQWFAEFAAQKNIDCKILDIAKTSVATIKQISRDTLIFIISPIHGFNFPKITLDFIRHFPKGTNNIVLMNTRAGVRIGSVITPGLTGVAFILSSFILKRKGYKIMGQIPFDMPSNWISLHPALREKSINFLHKKNYYRVKKHAEKIFSSKPDFLAYRDIIQDILISPISLAYYLIGRFAFAKSFYASFKCDNCGICVKQCPVNAIEIIKDRPFWTFKCESCMKCMNNCPKRAIETAHGFFVMLFFVESILSSFILYIFFVENVFTDILRFLLGSLFFIVLLWILYRLQHLLLRNKFIGKLIPLTSLTYFNFWGRYKSTPDYKWKHESKN